MSGREPIRYQGEVVEWSNKKRCGFIRPRGSSENDPLVFVSLSSMSGQRNVPSIGDALTYELIKLPNTRANQRLRTLYRAHNAVLLGDTVHTATPTPLNQALLILGAVYLVSLGLTVPGNRTALYLFMISMASSAVSMLLHLFDKNAAQNRDWRVAELTLIKWSLIGGWPGALLAQELLRHKTRKMSFQAAFRFVVIANVLLTGAILFLSRFA